MLLFDILFLILLGFFVGIVASMTGTGGGMFIVPLLSIVYNFTSQEAVGTSLSVIVFTSFASSYAYFRQKRIDYKIGFVSSLTTVPGAFLGAYLTSLISSYMLGIVFSFSALFMALHMIFNWHIPLPKMFKNIKSSRRRLVDSSSKVFEYETNMYFGFILSFFGGLYSGLLGIGGGTLIVPILNVAVGLPMHISVATSMFTMIFTSLAGVATHFNLNNIRLEHSLYIAIGVIIGSQIGAKIAKKVSGEFLRKVFSLVLIIISVRFLMKFV